MRKLSWGSTLRPKCNGLGAGHSLRSLICRNVLWSAVQAPYYRRVGHSGLYLARKSRVSPECLGLYDKAFSVTAATAHRKRHDLF